MLHSGCCWCSFLSFLPLWLLLLVADEVLALRSGDAGGRNGAEDFEFSKSMILIVPGLKADG